jgi:WD40 repeat protein
MPVLFDNPRFVAPAFIVSLVGLPDGRLLALTNKHAVLFDGESGQVLTKTAIEENLARGRVVLDPDGARALVHSEYDATACFVVDLDGLAFRKVTCPEDGATGDFTRFSISSTRIVRATSSGTTVLDPRSDAPTGAAVPGPLDGTDSPVVVGSSGAVVVWKSGDTLACRTISEDGSHSDVAIEELGGSIYGDPALSRDEKRLAIPVVTDEYKLQLAIFDPRTGAEITNAETRLSQGGTRQDVELGFSPDGELLIALVGNTLQCWSIAKSEMLWSKTNWGPLGGIVFHPNGKKLALARGERIAFVDLATGKRTGVHEGPAQTITSIVRDKSQRIVAKDAHRAYVIENGAVRDEVRAWSCHDDDGEAFIYGFDGVLLRAFPRLSPVAEPRLQGESTGHPTTVQLRRDWLLYPDPNEQELLHLTNRHERGEVAKLGERPVHEARFAGDDAIAIVHAKYDDEDGELRQSVALWSRTVPTTLHWETPIASTDLATLLAASGSAVVVQHGNVVVVHANEGGEVIAQLELESIAGAAFVEADAIVVAGNGDVLRVSTAKRSIEKVANVGAGATAFHVDVSGRAIVAFGCQTIHEVDLGLPRRVVPAPREPKRKVPSSNHDTEIAAFGLSPDGSLLATGSFVGDDYERGGSLQIWDAKTGHVLHALDPIDGGVGWPDERDKIQWSPDGKELAIAYTTNAVGIFDPFGEAPLPRMSASTTNGWDRPPAFRWSPNGETIAISSWSERSFIPCCVVDTSEQTVDDFTARWFARKEPQKAADDEERTFKDAADDFRFDADGTTLYAHNAQHGQTWAVDLATGALRYEVTSDDSRFAWSACGRYLASVTEDGAVRFRSTPTGEELATFQHEAFEDGVSPLCWSKTGSRLAVAGGEHVLFFEGTELLGSHEVVASDADSSSDAYPLVWSPDGARVAVLGQADDDDEKKRLEVLAVSADAITVVGSVDVSAKVGGILWNAPDRIVCLGKEILESVTVDGGTLTKSFSRDLSPEAKLP